MANRKGQDLQGPSKATVKRLFAHSGNRCAFPGCKTDLVQGDVIVGEICHIKAASPNGPRYDVRQSARERQGYDNLVLLCAIHHKVVDTDPSHTAERLSRMKAYHMAHRPTGPAPELAHEREIFITNHFHAPVNAVAHGHASIGSANQNIEAPHQHGSLALKISIGESGPFSAPKVPISME